MDDNLETICNDKSAWWSYDFGNEGKILVYARCNCGRYLKHGEIFTNWNGEIKFIGWNCKKHGEQTPYFEWD